MPPLSDEIRKWLARHGLAVYTSQFLEHRITLELLPELQEGDLDELKIAPEHRKLLQQALTTLAGEKSNKLTVSGSRSASGTVTRAERRHMTVMFIDIAQSSRLSNTLDPQNK